MPRDDPQLNVRLSQEESEVLEAAAWVKRSGKTELAKEAILEAVARYEKDPAVKQALDARRAADEGSQGSVTPIGQRGAQSSSSRKRP